MDQNLSTYAVILFVVLGLISIYVGIFRRNTYDGILPEGVAKIKPGCYVNLRYRYNVQPSKKLPGMIDVSLVGDSPTTIGKPDSNGFVRVLDSGGRTQFFRKENPDRRSIYRVQQSDLYPFYNQYSDSEQPDHGMWHFTLADTGRAYTVSLGALVNPLDVIGIPGTKMFMRIPLPARGDAVAERIGPYEPVGNVWWATPKP